MSSIKQSSLSNTITGGIIGAIFTLSFVGLYLLMQPVETDLTRKAAMLTSSLNGTVLGVADIVDVVNPAVVAISITEEVPSFNRVFDNPFEDFFGLDIQVPLLEQDGTIEREVGGGSGFIVSEDGYLVTNAHVVSSIDATYTVHLPDGRDFIADVIDRDTMLDIALLKIDGQQLPYLTFGDSEQLRLGQSVIAIGNALAEYSNSVSTGVVSGLSRSIIAGDNRGNSELLDNVIQTDAAINPGNSGGPLLNLRGEVIGVNVAVASGSENIGFALPSNTVQMTIESIIENGRVIRPYIGVQYIPVPFADIELPVQNGAYVTGENAILNDSPAAKAGLQEGDIILSVNEDNITQEQSLAILIRRYNVGDKVTLRILRGEDELTTTLTLEEMPS
ncbi:MAG: trypsin-like peptidase domain-containing protein [bacterium]|nr:trypsin-like peptidase domain-containing protein [bacterium]